ncbi:MAG: hypothetical protein AAGG81_01975 [Chlamydiota bacterium]
MNINHQLTAKSEHCINLKPMAGEPVNDKRGQSTYCRQFTDHNGSISHKLRFQIRKVYLNTIDGSALKDFGERYSFTPQEKRDGRNFGTNPPNFDTNLLNGFIGGGFFLTLKEIDEVDKKISSLEYVIRTLKSNLSAITALTTQEIISQATTYGVGYVTHYFFEPVDLPKNGDLVVYPNTVDSSHRTHCGIFRESKPNWNSPNGGTVESKWLCESSRYVFQHDIFFVHPEYGNIVNFFRIKKDKVIVESLVIHPHKNAFPSHRPHLITNERYNVCENGSLKYNATERNEERRESINNLCRTYLTKKLPEIEYLEYINYTGGYHGICYDYAFERIFLLHDPIDIPNAESHGVQILESYFTLTTHPQKGDLVVYYESNAIVHWAIYLENETVESKWGEDDVYRHHLFDVPPEYGDTIKCFRLNDGLQVVDVVIDLKARKLEMIKNSITKLHPKQ